MKYCFIMLFAFLKCIAATGQGLDGSPAGIMISHGHPKGGWMISYTYMHTMMKDNLSGTSSVSDEMIFAKNYAMAPNTMKMDMHMIMSMYGVTGRFSLMLMADYNQMNMEMTAYSERMDMAGGTMIMSSPYMTTTSSGFGDTKLYGLYKLLNGNGSQLVLSAGVSIPTGKTDIDGGENYLNMRLPYMMQTGTGSVDFMPGISFLKKIQKITWSAQFLTVIRPFNNSSGYHFGNEATVNVWASFQFKPLISASLRFEGYSSGSISGMDPKIYSMNEPGSDPKNYGGQRGSGYAGINFYINKGFMRDSKFCVEYGSPFYQNLNGPQLSIQNILNVGFTKSF